MRVWEFDAKSLCVSISRMVKLYSSLWPTTTGCCLSDVRKSSRAARKVANSSNDDHHSIDFRIKRARVTCLLPKAILCVGFSFGANQRATGQFKVAPLPVVSSFGFTEWIDAANINIETGHHLSFKQWQLNRMRCKTDATLLVLSNAQEYSHFHHWKYYKSPIKQTIDCVSIGLHFELIEFQLETIEIIFFIV